MTRSEVAWTTQDIGSHAGEHDNQCSWQSAQAQLSSDALAGEQLGAKTNHKAHHGQTAVPGLSKSNKAEAGSGFGHEC